MPKYSLKKAWHETLATHQAQPPWPWADTWPVARLHYPATDDSYYVLANSDGSSLAFGPGHVSGSALPEEPGTIVLSGHRDTHFRFLEGLAPGATLTLQSKNGLWRHFEFKRSTIANIHDGPWQFDPGTNELHLITCYPFDDVLPGGDLRFIAIAEEIPPTRVDHATIYDSSTWF